MARFLPDENFNAKIVYALTQREPALIVETVQKLDMSRTPDPALLAWAARKGLILLSHDRNTMCGYANQRIRLRQPVAGLVICDQLANIGRIVDDLLLMNKCYGPDDWKDCIQYLPL